MEMNTRLQVEHTISEEVYNIDIVKEQISVSSGQKLSICQNNIKKMVTQLNVELMRKTNYIITLNWFCKNISSTGRSRSEN